MNSVLTLLRLDLKSKFGLGNRGVKKSIASVLINAFFSLVIYTVFIFGVIFLTRLMVTGSVPLRYEFLVIATGVSMIVQFVVCTGILVRNLYYDGENELLLRFPVDGTQIFAAKAIYTFIYNLFVALLFTYPLYVSYGVLTAANAGFYVSAFFFVPLIAILPFCLANLFALPVINLTNFLKNRFALILALMIIMVVFGFAFYMLLLKGVLEYAQNKSPNLLTAEIRENVRRIAAGLVPFNWYANILYGRRVWQSLLIVLSLCVAFGAVALFVSKKTVYRIVLHSIEREAEAFEIKTKETVRPVFASLLRKEYLLIFRSLNYSFQYLAMAITAPVMVYFCNDLASSIGDASVGGRIIPGLTLLVVIIFISIIVSFASTAISREGDAFYLTKIMPVSYRYQVLVKLVLYFVVASASVLISCLVVWAAFGGERYGNNVTFVDILSIFGIAELVIVALTCSAVKSDLKSPTFAVSKNGELVDANKNVSSNLLYGCVTAVIFGLVTMIFSYFPLSIGKLTLIKNTAGAYLTLFIVALLMAGFEVLTLFRNLDKNYNKIKPE